MNIGIRLSDMTNKDDTITVVSSRAVDILLRKDGTVIDKIEGGPAFFIESALRDANVPFRLNEGEQMTVNIEVRKDGEYGKVTPASTRRSLGDIDINGWCMVSTLLDEWKIEGDLPDRLFVDIQGYVRDGTDFGLKQSWPLDRSTTSKIFCLKGTEEEVCYIPDDIIDEQKKERMLVVTQGRRGAAIYYEGNKYSIPARPLNNLPDTVGAGDTFFSYYIAALFNGSNAEDAGYRAIRKTREFLEKKLAEA